ncbi:hypothetical protein BZG13_12360 [Salinivibrio sp. ML323]|uniref:Uncharacterized protein n=1 Tax=Salinivibrio kushneri TaxID=1908198 RepID=A0AB36JZW3_9GAMM|nr:MULTISPECIES: hypothetical protein [Salinivibrio]OOE33518.1 hypothetical protein BZG05_10830 [Salinivibrio kushneri]OOE40739.1 hypothetical protein BZG00_04865 [Salinivibrio kushneri]OOE47476.1 hypothetical protein BZG06_02755 [Salinivibrio kushneri]OOE57115.1 hypothetical protein BZG13_12360 [Salinivibrio sp. ML323]OOE64751.1 hypothetical protein BZG14_07025 [Salinivibrio sp. IB282]
MTVMNNTFTEPTAFSTSEIVAARNAFLQYDLNKQVELLTVMPHEECMAVLGHCSVTHVHQLLERLNAQGHQRLANKYARCLGMIRPHRSLHTGVGTWIHRRRAKLFAFLSLVLAVAAVSYLSVFVFV